MVGFFQILQIISGLFVILLVILHSPKGDGIASIGGASQLFSSQKGVESGLNKLTAIFSSVFILLSMFLGFGLIR
jgi:preprotein translocase subunit SecG